MADESAPHTSGVIAELTERQYGVLSAAQLYALGFSKDWVGRRVAAGWLHRLHRGVYAVGHRRLARRGHWMGAVLACGHGAVLSHRSAAALWSIRPQVEPDLIDVTLRTRAGRRRRRGIRVHRPRRLPDDELTTHWEIPATGPARTILDLGSMIDTRPLERAIDEADRLKLVAADDLVELLRRHPGHPGARKLRRVLAPSPGWIDGHAQRAGGAVPGALSPSPPSPAAGERSATRLCRRLPLAGGPPGRRGRRTRDTWHPAGLSSRPGSGWPPGGGGIHGPEVHLVGRHSTACGRRRPRSGACSTRRRGGGRFDRPIAE
jgi:hypothetical protein